MEIKVVGANIEVDFLYGTDTQSVGTPAIVNSGYNWQQFLDPVFSKPIKHRVAFTTGNFFAPGLFVKGAAGTNAEKVNWDYVGVANLR